MNRLSTIEACDFRAARFYSSQSATQRVAVAVSACLAGEKVRYDGADKRIASFSLLRAQLHLVSICPEFSAGLGVPRPPVRLVETETGLKALGRDDATLDVTAALQEFAQRSSLELIRAHQLCGYLWKSRSPSCGFYSTPIFTANGVEIERGSGIQAAYFQRHLPHLSHCEESALPTTCAAAAFILRCRLVFDVLYASAAPLHELHRHYAFLHRQFESHIAAKLESLSAEEHKSDYLAAFLEGCRQLPEDKLLELFIE